MNFAQNSRKVQNNMWGTLYDTISRQKGVENRIAKLNSSICHLALWMSSCLAGLASFQSPVTCELKRPEGPPQFSLDRLAASHGPRRPLPQVKRHSSRGLDWGGPPADSLTLPWFSSSSGLNNRKRDGASWCHTLICGHLTILLPRETEWTRLYMWCSLTEPLYGWFQVTKLFNIQYT